MSFRARLRARTPFPVATPILILINVVVFAMMLFGDGSLGSPSTMISWGANLGERTTNGEWWRLVTSLFVHWGFLHLLANTIGVVLVGLLVEQMVGSVTFVADLYRGRRPGEPHFHFETTAGSAQRRGWRDFRHPRPLHGHRHLGVPAPERRHQHAADCVWRTSAQDSESLRSIISRHCSWPARPTTRPWDWAWSAA